jgi:hypothetical protein
MSDAVVDREEIELMMWALADIRTGTFAILRILAGDDEEEAEESDDS